MVIFLSEASSYQKPRKSHHPPLLASAEWTCTYHISWPGKGAEPPALPLDFQETFTSLRIAAAVLDQRNEFPRLGVPGYVFHSSSSGIDPNPRPTSTRYELIAAVVRTTANASGNNSDDGDEEGLSLHRTLLPFGWW
jgi:hypothetical protein